MKRMYVYFSIVITLVYFTGCDTDNRDHYIDLETGKTISVEKDSTAGYIINAETRKPVDIYVNTKTHDTIYGKTGEVINNHVSKHPDGRYTYEPAVELKVADGDYKEKVQDDGDIKIKDGDTKIKIEGDGKKIKRK
jgi:hypothetical protein